GDFMEAVIFEVADFLDRANPDAPQMIAEQRVRKSLCKSFISVSVDRDLAVFPADDAIRGGDPDTAVGSSSDGPQYGGRKTLIGRQGGGNKLAKAVEAVICRHPNTAFVIFQKIHGVRAGNAVGSRINVGAAVVDVDESPAKRGNPQGAVAIMRYTFCPDFPDRHERKVWVHFSVEETVDTLVPSDQKGSIGVFAEGADSANIAGQRIELRSAGSPAPQSV